jgi:hypothetical protein
MPRADIPDVRAKGNQGQSSDDYEVCASVERLLSSADIDTAHTIRLESAMYETTPFYP